MRQLVKLGELLEEDARKKVAILAVSIDTHEQSKSVLDDLLGGATTPVRILEDREHRVIDRYGLRNEKVKSGIPHPATYVIGRDGKVRWRFVEVDYSKRPSNEDVLAALRESGVL